MKITIDLEGKTVAQNMPFPRNATHISFINAENVTSIGDRFLIYTPLSDSIEVKEFIKRIRENSWK